MIARVGCENRHPSHEAPGSASRVADTLERCLACEAEGVTGVQERRDFKQELREATKISVASCSKSVLLP